MEVATPRSYITRSAPVHRGKMLRGTYTERLSVAERYGYEQALMTLVKVRYSLDTS